MPPYLNSLTTIDVDYAYENSGFGTLREESKHFQVLLLKSFPNRRNILLVSLCREVVFAKKADKNLKIENV